MIIQADHIYVFKDGKPVSLYLGNIYKNDSIYGLIDSRFHISYENNLYKFSDQYYEFKIESLRDINDNTIIFKITPLNENPRFTDLTIEIYNPDGEYKYLINIFTTDKSKHWNYYTKTNIPIGEVWKAKIRDLDNTGYDYKDQFWKYRLSNYNINIL